MARILRVNLGDQTLRLEDIPRACEGLGGRGLTSAIVALEVPPTAEPLGPNNKLVFAPGLLGGTRSANSGRLSVGCKSPLTSGIKEANSGGQPGGHLARLGLAAVVVEGRAEPGTWWQLELDKDGARLVPSETSGLNNYESVDRLAGRHGRRASFISIGRAGEFRLAAASIALTDRDGLPSRHAGRGGVGAVMGSKGLKAIVINPEGAPAPPLVDSSGFSQASRRFARALKQHPVCGQMAAYGSAAMMNLFNEAGAVPTRNFSSGRFENPEAVSGENLNRLTRERGGEGRVAKGCMQGCLIRCSGVFPDREGRRVGKWPDYETLWAFGPNTGIDDLDMIARYDRLCDDTGVDTIDVGAAIALMMEAGRLEFGDAAGALKLVEEISAGTMTGRVIGSGAAVTGRVLGLSRVPQVKGQALSAFDPRSVKGQGAAFATNPQGADHTAGPAYAANLLAIGGEVDPLAVQGQVELAREAQVSAAAIDTLGLCLFVSFAVFETPAALKAIVDMLNARYGWSTSVEDLAGLGRRVLDLELDFNRRAGFTAADDRLPEFMTSEKVGPHNSTFDIPEADLDRTLRW